MPPPKGRRDLRKLLGELGIAGEIVRDTNHLVWRMTNQHGVTRIITTAKTPSDWRSWQNKLQQLRKFAKEKPE